MDSAASQEIHFFRFISNASKGTCTPTKAIPILNMKTVVNWLSLLLLSITASASSVDLDNAVYVNALGQEIIPQPFEWGRIAVKDKNAAKMRHCGMIDGSGRLGRRQATCPNGYTLACTGSEAFPCCPTDSPQCECSTLLHPHKAIADHPLFTGCPNSDVCCAANQICQGTSTCCSAGQIGCGEACCDSTETCCGTNCCSAGFTCSNGSCLAPVRHSSSLTSFWDYSSRLGFIIWSDFNSF